MKCNEGRLKDHPWLLAGGGGRDHGRGLRAGRAAGLNGGRLPGGRLDGGLARQRRRRRADRRPPQGEPAAGGQHLEPDRGAAAAAEERRYPRPGAGGSRRQQQALRLPNRAVQGPGLLRPLHEGPGDFMYYDVIASLGADPDSRATTIQRFTALAISHDGEIFTKPNLGAAWFNNSRQNNLVWPRSDCPEKSRWCLPYNITSLHDWLITKYYVSGAAPAPQLR